MSLGNWFKSLFGSVPKRDVSRLSTQSAETPEALNVLEEQINTSGGPLKEHHRRRALRDRRLLPKAKSPVRQLGLAKRKRVMSLDDAERLFGATLRTRNRNLRDLLTDEGQLNRYNLPVWKSEEDVARALGISLRELWFFAIHRERERQPHYVIFAIPKRSGGKRLIMAPKRRLKSIQRKLLEVLVGKLPVSGDAHAFRQGRSIRTGAEPHVGKRFVLKLDLKDFFPSITFARIRGMLIAYGYSYPVATALAVLLTEAERQSVEVDGEVFHVPVGLRHCVQGAPTSPGLCNALVLRMDHRLAGAARKYGASYTRYADDLTFSGDMERATAARLRLLVERIVSEEGFVINQTKTRLMGQGGRQTVTGVVVNRVLGLSRQERRRMRAELHRIQQLGENGDRTLINRAEGKLAYLLMLNPAQASRLRP